MPASLATGDYARKQIYCPNRLVAWSHGSRFALAQRLAAQASGGALLDYGCGDATFIALSHAAFRRTVGADVDVSQLAECHRRFGDLPRVEFVTTSELESPEHSAAYDVVTCMEVLEHCPDDERRRVLDQLARLVGEGGTVIISVPIEVGPALAAKQMCRAIAAWRGQGDYRHRETYSVGELVRAVAARGRLARAEYVVPTPDGSRNYCGHKGFDWRVLEREIRERFGVERRLFSPMPYGGWLLNSQVWFVCRPRR